MPVSTAAAKKALADGVWVEKKDPKSGKAYYMNKATKKTTWDLDKELGKAPAASGGSATTPAKPAQSPTTPKPAASGSTAAKPADPVAAALASGEWVEKKDPKSGKAYYMNKATKKTTWDLAKELGATAAASPAAAPATGGQVAASKPADPGKPLPGQQRTVAQVLAEGVWVERSDPKTGRAFYFNKDTKKATWDLVKELGLAPAAAAATAATAAKPVEQPQQSSPATASATNSAYSVDHVLASGKWKASKDFNGSTYYMNVETGETTADLALYLQIQQALDGADDVCAGRGDSGAEGGTDMSEWVSLILRAPGHEQAADRLIAPHVQRRLDDAERAVKTARQAEDEQRRRAEGLERASAQLRDAAAAHQREIHQLQCAVFYGLQGGGGHGGYAPAMIDPVSAANTSNPGSLGTRVEYLENLLRSVQGHNRQLQAELEGLRRRGHEQATCRHCDDNDAFTRVLRKAAPIDGQHGPAAAAPRPMADPYAVTSTITPPSLLAPSPVAIAADRAHIATGNAALARLHHSFDDRGHDRRTVAGVPAPLSSFPTSRQLQFVGSSADQVDLHAVPSAITHGSPLRHGIAGRR